ncbi:MAG: thioesterase family protein [Pseudomonadota bacterium]
MIFSTTLSPRFYETDALGHINNVTIAAWFEVARMGFLASLPHLEDISANDWALASVQIDYLEETFFGDDVELIVTDVKVGTTSLTVLAEIWQKNQRTVRGKSVLVHFDPKSKKSKPIPDSLRKQVNALDGP